MVTDLRSGRRTKYDYAERIKKGKTPYILNAIDSITELVIAQLPM